MPGIRVVIALERVAAGGALLDSALVEKPVRSILASWICPTRQMTTVWVLAVLKLSKPSSA